MASSLRYAALAAMISSIYGYSLGEMPSQTIGVGLPLFELFPTQAPSPELVKKSLDDKRALTNTCNDWALDGLGGTPLCGDSQTCLFTSASDGFLYEGCGQTSIAYDWITECWPYPQTQTGIPGVSEIFCDATAPACGYYAFVYDIGQTFWNFGCSVTSFSSTARLVDSSATNALVGNEGATVGDITSANDPATTFPPSGTEEITNTPTDAPTGILGSGSSGSTKSPTIKSNSRKKKKAPLGPIIGGVVGGVIVVIAISVLVWFILRKNKRSKAAKLAEANLQQDPAAGSAFQNQQQYSELGGDGKPQPPPAAYMNSVAYGQNPSEKPVGGAYMNSAHGNELGGENVSMQSPPSLYAPPHQLNANYSPPQNYPPSNYSELPNNGRQSMPPVSPAGTYSQDGVSPGGAGTVSNLTTPTLNAVPLDLASTQPPAELGNTQPQKTQQQASDTNQTSPRPQEMSGTSGIARRPVRQSAGMDMSGNPTTDNYPHELA